MADTLGWMCGTCRGSTPQGHHLQPNPGIFTGICSQTHPPQEDTPSHGVTIPGHRSTGAIHSHPCCGTWADTHITQTWALRRASQSYSAWEHGVMVAMVKQSQCLNLERSKENVPIPAGRAATAQWLLQHHLMWSSAMSTIPKAEHVPLTPGLEKAAERPWLVPAAVDNSECCGVWPQPAGSATAP